MRRKLSGFTLGIFLCSTGFAQAPATIAIKGARLIDGVSDQPVLNAVVVVEGNRIIAVGPQSVVKTSGRSTMVGWSGAE